MPILTASNLALLFGEVEIFAGVDLLIDERDRIGIVGPNGAGKHPSYASSPANSKPTQALSLGSAAFGLATCRRGPRKPRMAPSTTR